MREEETEPGASPQEGGVDVDALDGSLSPLRRVVRYALRHPESPPRHVGAIAGRLLAPFQDAPFLLGDARAPWDDLQAALVALDGASDTPQAFQDLARAILRLDAILGLPRVLRVRRKFRRARPAEPSADLAAPERDPPEREPAEERPAPRPEPKRRGEPPASRPEPPPVSRWGEEVALAIPLEELAAPNEVLDALADRQINDVGGLLFQHPASYVAIQPVWGAGRVGASGRAAVGGRVKSRVTICKPEGGGVTDVVLVGAGPVVARWAAGAPPWMVERLAPGTRAVLVGESELVDVGPSLLHDAELAHDDGSHTANLAEYGIAEVSDAAIRALVQQGLAALGTLPEPLPAEILEKNRLIGLGEALQAAHLHGAPPTARRRLAYDEALLVHLGLFWSRYQGPRERGYSHALLHGLAARLVQISDTELADEHHAALEEIKRDLRAPTPMRRVLTGEVASGKGLVALLAAVIVAENKHQVMVLSPDQATAEQRFAFTEPVLRDLGLVARLAADEPGKVLREAVRRGEVHLVFGTTRLLEADLEFRRLGLVVAGEREVFGAIPPLVAAIRPTTPDLLLVTANPVPPPVLLAAYPHFDVTVLRGGGVGGVTTVVMGPDQREEAYQLGREAIARGEQVLVVFPLARGADVLGLGEAHALVATFSTSVFPGARVKLFHGGMSREERYRTWLDARDHRVDVIVATTHFEAGPAVPHASLVVIEQADRMSLGRLHRVRGQVAMSGGEGRCILITGDDPDLADLQNLRAFASSQGGFEVSAQEFAARGLGGMLSAEAQATVPAFQWLDPGADLDILMAGRDEARRLLEPDAGLRKSAHPDLLRYLKLRWEALLRTPCPLQNVGGSAAKRRRRRRKR